MADLDILNFSRRWDNAADFPALDYSRDWNSAADFPTVETDEARVRADMQFLYDEIRDYVNGALRSYLAGIGAPGSLREAQNPAVRVTLTLGSGWTADPAGGWSLPLTVRGVTGNTRVDLRAGADTRAGLAADGVTALWVENSAGTLTARCLGAAPAGAVELQAELFETQPAAGVLNGVVLGDALTAGGAGGGSASGGGAAGSGGGVELHPVARTSAMTQAVGVDAAGRLWTAPVDAVDVSVVGQ